MNLDTNFINKSAVVDFLFDVVYELVDNPEDFLINQVNDENGPLLTLLVNPKDYGRVIGKDGETARGLRAILVAYGTRHHGKYSIKIGKLEK